MGVERSIRDQTWPLLLKSEVRSLKPLRSRSGYTLVELLIVITFFSLLLVMATRLIVVMYGAERTVRSRVERAITLDRLAHQFQRDVRSAEKVLRVGRAPLPGEDLPPPWTPGRPERAVILRLQIAEGVVEYAEVPGHIERSFLPGQADPQVAGEREQFRLPESARVEVAREPSVGMAAQVVALTVHEGGPAAGEAATPRLRILAVRGGDLRLARPARKDGT